MTNFEVDVRMIQAYTRSLGRVGLQDYLESMDRTTKALGDLQHSNLRSNEQAIGELNGLLRIGSEELENTFRETLGREAAPIVALHYMMKGSSRRRSVARLYFANHI